jgi:EAL domain-containing protein (putative c-di-GMP-specific phosphodiesterase class I)
MRGNFDGICQQVRRALEPTSTHGVWLYDADARICWMTSSILNDEVAARTALRAFASLRPPAVFVLPVGRDAGLPQNEPWCFVAFRVADAKRRLLGTVMVVVNTAVIPPAVAAKMAKPLAEFAELLPPLESTREAPVERAPVKSAPVAPQPARAKPAAAEPVPPKPAAPEPALAAPVERRQRPRPEAEAAQRRLLRAVLTMYAQRFIPLEKTTRPKRYELLWELPENLVTPELEAKAGSLIHRRVFGDLVTWLLRHPRVAADTQTTLSLKLSKGALYDPDFMPFVQRCLARAALPSGMIGFEIPAATPRKHLRAVTDLAVSLQDSGCFLVLDNFTLRTECFNALQLPGLRVIKLSHDLTARMYTDKIMRAAIPSITQMAKVLDVQTVVKRTRMAADLIRLSAYGLDYVQSAAIAPAMPIDVLGKMRAPDSDDPRPEASGSTRRHSRTTSLAAE